jgi:hypothetical protein
MEGKYINNTKGNKGKPLTPRPKIFLNFLITLPFWYGYCSPFLVLFAIGKEANAMYEYMKALRQRFFTEPECAETRQEIDEIHHQLVGQMTKDDRRKLLKMTDLEIGLRDDTSLASFVAGFRLAWGIAKELSVEPPYSFAAEEEKRACEAIEQGRDR